MTIEKSLEQHYGDEEIIFITNATVRELLNYCTENDIDLDSAEIAYGSCGSHEVILEVQK